MPQVFGWSDDDFEDQANDLAALIRRVWRAIARLIAAQAEAKSMVTLEIAQPIPLRWQEAVDDQIVGFVRNVYLDAAGAVSDAVNAPDELLIGDDLVEVYTNAARNRLVGIGDDVWKNVQAQITLGNQMGESIGEIAARIRNVAGVSEARSLTIARTEVHAAFESGAHEQAMFVDPNATKIWLATEDERTRTSHRRADGQKAKIGGTFKIGDAKLRFPGDPLGEPGETINCRCSVAYDFDMITTVVDEPEPAAMTAAGGQSWKPHMHPRGSDGKFIEKGAVSDFLKKAKPNVIDVQKAVLGLNADQWKKLTPEQKDHIEASVDKLPKGTQTHTSTKAALDTVKSAAGTTGTADAPAKYKPKLIELLKNANHGDVIASGTKYNSAGAGQKFRIIADKSHVASYMPNGKMRLEYLKKDGSVGKTITSTDGYTIHSSLTPLPMKGKKPAKVDWDDPNAAGTPAPVDTPNVDAPAAPTPSATAATPTKIPAGLKGKPGDPAKITTGVVWGKHAPGDVVLEGGDGFENMRVVWNGKKFEIQADDGDGWTKQYDLSKKDFYTNHKGDTGWVIPGGEKTGGDGFSTDEETGQLLDELLGPETTPEPPQTPSAPKPQVAPPTYDPYAKMKPGDITVDDAFASLDQYAPGDLVGKYTYKKDGITKSQYEFRKSKDGTGIVMYEKPFGMPSFVAQKKYTSADDMKKPGGFHFMKKVEPKAKPISATNDMSAGNADTGGPDWTKDQDFSGFSKIGGQAGSNPGGKYKAPNGDEWYIKQPKSAKHAANEQAAAAFYNLADVDAPQVMVGKGAPELGGKFQTGTKIVPGAKANLGSKLNDKNYVKEIQSGFAIDAWLANWDVAGMGYDNIVEGADGKPHRIDVGGAMLYRAQGEPKSGKFGDSVDELQTLRDGTNPQAAKIFGSMTEEDIRKSAAKVEAISEEQIDKIIADAGLPPSVANTLKMRRQDILSKYPPLKEINAPAPTVESAKAKLDKQWEKGLLTADEYFDLTGENPPGYNGVHDKGVLLNDLESGAILAMPQAIDLAMMLDKSDYDDLSLTEKTQLQTTLSTAADMDYLGGKDAYAHWQTLHKPNSSDTDTSADALTDEPDVSKIATSPTGALMYLDDGDNTKMVSSDGKFVLEKIDSPMGKYSLETKNGQSDGSSVFAFINNADDIDYVTGDEASLWYPAKPKVDTDADTSAPPTGPMISGDSLGLKPLHEMLVIGKANKKYSDGQAVAVSSDGTRQLVWRDAYNGYAIQDNETGNEDFVNTIHAIKMIRDGNWHVPENLLTANHGGTQVTTPNAPDADAAKSGVSNAGAMGTLALGEADVMMTPDGKWELYKSADGKWTALKENHPNGTSTVNLIDTASEINHYAGAQTWHPKQEIEQSINAPGTTSGVSNKPVDTSVIQENIDLGEYTSGETIGITEDGQQKLVYSAFLGGVQLKTKVANTGDDDMDWDTEASYSDDTGSPVADFLDDYPGIKLFEEQPADESGSTTDWDNILSGLYEYNDVVAQTKGGEYQLVHKGSGTYNLYKKQPMGYIAQSGWYNPGDLASGDLDTIDGESMRWSKVAPGAKFASGLAKKTAAKKAAKKAGVPSAHAYTPAVVTPGEKKFYLDDAAAGELVPSEAVHLLNGEGGLSLEDVKALSGPQTANINAQLGKALDKNEPGSAAAWQKWAEFENQLNAGNGYDASQFVDQSYLLDMEDEMWGGNKSTGDVIAITADGKQRLVINSTEGPGMNPDSFALETHGPFGWETTEVYKLGDGTSPHNQFWNAHGYGGKAWLVADDTAMPSTPSTGTVSFDPPGHGDALPGTLFDMLSWVPEGKPLLVGKNDKAKYLMTADKSGAGAKAIKISYWDENDKTFKPAGYFDDEQTYNWWAGQSSSTIKWDTPGAMGDKSALEKHFPDHNKFSDAAGPEPDMVEDGAAKLMPDLNPENINDIWDHIQTLDVGTPIGAAKNAGGEDIRAVVWANELGEKKLQIQKKKADGSWENSHVLQKQGFAWDLEDYKWSPATGDAAKPAAPPAAAPELTTANLDFTESTENAVKIWAALPNFPDGTELATTTTPSGLKKKMVVQSTPDGLKYLDVQAYNQYTADWEDYGDIQNVTYLKNSLAQNWVPTGVSAPTPAAPAATTPATPTAPTASVAKVVSGSKVTDLKFHLKQSGNLGYYSKPENIWAAVKEWQSQPGNDQYSPMDLFKALDGTLKTSKPSPFQEKMKKWAASKKGAQIIGADGILGPAPTAAPAAPKVPALKPGNHDAVWAHIQTMNAGDIVAINEKGDKRLKVITDGPGKKTFMYESKNNITGAWSYYAGGNKMSLKNLLEKEKNPGAWNYEGWVVPTSSAPSTPSTPSTPATPSAAAPDFTANNVDAIWQHIQTLPNDTVVAHGTNTYGDEQRFVVKGATTVKYLQAQTKLGSGDWTYSHGMTKKVDLKNELDSPYWTFTPTDDYKTGKKAGKKTKPLPDIEAGNDISGISEDKQQQVYTKFKGEPFTYLKSPEHSIFDALETVAKSEGLTIAQVLAIVDEYGAKKFSVANTGPFKAKIAAWLKTPEAAAHINNDPKVVKGLPTPPAFDPKYDPDLNPGQIPSFEESSKYEYKPLTTSAANALWNDVTKKTEPISSSQISALKVWISGAYHTINGFLYQPNQSPLSSTHKSGMNGSQKGMRPSTKPVLLVRGTGFEGLGNAKNHNQLEKLVGTTWRNNAFAATSIKDTGPSAYGAGDPDNAGAPAFASFPLWIEFECPPGTPMAWLKPFSGLPHEREMLLAANLHYKILSVEKKMIPGHGMKSIARVRIVPKPEDASE